MTIKQPLDQGQVIYLNITGSITRTALLVNIDRSSRNAVKEKNKLTPNTAHHNYYKIDLDPLLFLYLQFIYNHEEDVKV